MRPRYPIPGPTRWKPGPVGTVVNQANPYAANLVAPFLFNEGRGTKVSAVTPANVTGTGKGSPGWAEHNGIQGIDFVHASNQEVLIDQDVSRSKFVITRVYLSSASLLGIIAFIGTPGVNGYGFGVGGGTAGTGTSVAGNHLFYYGENVGFQDSGVNIGTGWHTLAMSFTATNVVLWLDGAQVYTGAFGGITTSAGTGSSMGGYNNALSEATTLTMDYCYWFTDLPVAASKVAAITARPYDLFVAPRLEALYRIAYLSAGTLFTASLSGGVTPTGALTKSTARALAGAMTPAGTIAKLTARSLTGSAASAGALTKQTSRSLTGAAASSGALAKSTGKPLAGTTASAGVLAKSTGRSLAGSVASSGALSKVEGKALSGSVASSGAITKSTSKALAGTAAPSGVLTKTTTRTLAGSVTSAGTLTGIKTKLMSFAGSVASGGILARSTAKTLTGTVASSGSLAKTTSKALAGTVAPTGVLTKTLTRALAGTVTSVGVLAKRTGKAMAGSVAIAGNLSTAIGHGVPFVLARATLTMLAAPSATMQLVLVPTATMGVV